jgi:hypothetical protein
MYPATLGPVNPESIRTVGATRRPRGDIPVRWYCCPALTWLSGDAIVTPVLASVRMEHA